MRDRFTSGEQPLLTERGRWDLESCVVQYATGPTALRDALRAGLAAFEAKTAIPTEHRLVLEEHTGGWFAQAHHVRALLASVNRRCGMETARFLDRYGRVLRLAARDPATSSSRRVRFATMADAIDDGLFALEMGIPLADDARTTIEAWATAMPKISDGAGSSSPSEEEIALRGLLRHEASNL